jgi:hypothetical protein
MSDLRMARNQCLEQSHRSKRAQQGPTYGVVFCRATWHICNPAGLVHGWAEDHPQTAIQVNVLSFEMLKEGDDQV